MGLRIGVHCPSDGDSLQECRENIPGLSGRPPKDDLRHDALRLGRYDRAMFLDSLDDVARKRLKDS